MCGSEVMILRSDLAELRQQHEQSLEALQSATFLLNAFENDIEKLMGKPLPHGLLLELERINGVLAQLEQS